MLIEFIDYFFFSLYIVWDHEWIEYFYVYADFSLIKFVDVLE